MIVIYVPSSRGVLCTLSVALICFLSGPLLRRIGTIIRCGRVTIRAFHFKDGCAQVRYNAIEGRFTCTRVRLKIALISGARLVARTRYRYLSRNPFQDQIRSQIKYLLRPGPGIDPDIDVLIMLLCVADYRYRSLLIRSPSVPRLL